eukprot:TRINITY_DN18219_c0_g2_i1.p1 TRINITY_DN18219_c0_g2~~TRINITY_DN18219_c0_g2_i1.p1  ORF type:complete len:601 (+),score=172.35 TRINITY_DN18219_c0_g2_i1:62-1804(+)
MAVPAQRGGMAAVGERRELLDGERKEPVLDDEDLTVPRSSMYLVFLTIFIDTLGASISTPVLPFYAKKFDVGDKKIGFLYASWSAASTICVPLLGWAADRWGRKTVLMVSLFGAGVAAFGQGMAPLYDYNYWIFFGFRALSGCFAAVGGTAQVYVTDVCKDQKALSVWLARLASVAPAALTFGTGLGGGLSKLGLNVPICVDGGLALVSCCIVGFYLQESPTWQAARASGEHMDKRQKKAASAGVFSGGAAVGMLALSGFFWGIGFSVMVSMYGLWALSRWDFDALRVGFVMVGASVISVATNIFLTPRLQTSATKKLGGNRTRGVRAVAVVGQTGSAVARMGMIFVPNGRLSYVWGSITCTCVERGLGSIAMPGRTTILGAITEPATRGQMFAKVQMLVNLGRFVGPIVSGFMAEWGGDGPRDWGDPTTVGKKGIEQYVWYMSAACLFISALAMLVVPIKDAEPVAAEPAQATIQAAPLSGVLMDRTASGAAWIDEIGSEEDEREMGRWLIQLLRERKYKWISERDQVLRLLERVIPDPTKPTDAYLSEVADAFGLDEGLVEKSTACTMVRAKTGVDEK